MSLFRNTTSETIQTVINGRKYVVPPGDVMQLGDEMDYCIKSRGLPLDRVDNVADLADAKIARSVPEVVKPVALPAGIEGGLSSPTAETGNDTTVGDSPASPDEVDVKDQVEAAVTRLGRKKN